MSDVARSPGRFERRARYATMPAEGRQRQGEDAMFIMFGWRKETRELASELRCHCYRCQRSRGWEHWKETEWVSFFMIKTIPFLSRSHVVCTACRDSFAIDFRRARDLAAGRGLPALAEHVEELQLAGKTEVQRRFLRAQRERHPPQ
jgi:hypothetical protein